MTKSFSNYFVYNGVKYFDTKKNLPFFEFTKQEVKELLKMPLKTTQDIDSFFKKCHLLFAPKKHIEYYELCTKNDDNKKGTKKEKEYKHIKTKHIVEKEMSSKDLEKFNYIKNLPALFTTIYDHFLSLYAIEYSMFDTKIEQIESIYTKEINTILKSETKVVHNYNEVIEQEKEMIVKKKELDLELKRLNSQFDTSEKKLHRLKIRYERLQEKFDHYNFKERMMRQKIKESNARLRELENNKNSSIVVPLKYLIASFGLLYYTPINTYKYQCSKEQKRIASLEVNIEKNKTNCLTIEHKIKTVSKQITDLEKIVEDNSKDSIEDTLQKIEDRLITLEEEKLQLEELQNTIERDKDNCLNYSKEIIEKKIHLLIEPIITTTQNITIFNTISTSKTKKQLKNGKYVHTV